MKIICSCEPVPCTCQCHQNYVLELWFPIYKTNKDLSKQRI